MLGLYIHIPFCRHICSYCDFYKMVVSDSLKEKTINYIIEEIDQRKISNLKIETIYIGGGTPSALPYYILEKLLIKINEVVNIDIIKEFTVELNPEDITDELVSLLSKYHVNRVSIGIQSFNYDVIKTLGRNPFVTINEIKEKIKLLNDYKINNINLDLIYAVPGQSIEMLKEDISIITSLNIQHISTYSLILEDHTIFDYLYQNNKLELINEDLDRKMYDLIKEEFKKAGFNQYETSNFSLNGFESLHNSNYWFNGDYLGIGPSASSHYLNTRFTNIRKLESYFRGIDSKDFVYDEYIELSLEDNYYDEVMLGLRLTKGISLEQFEKKYQIKINDVYPNINQLVEEGLLEIVDGFIRIPLEYTYISNYILVKIFE